MTSYFLAARSIGVWRSGLGRDCHRTEKHGFHFPVFDSTTQHFEIFQQFAATN